MSFPVRSRLLVVSSAAVLVAGLGLVAGAGPATAVPPAAALPVSDTGLWIVRLVEPSLAAAQAPRGRVDVGSGPARAYLAQLANQQAAVTERVTERLGRPVEVRHSYRNVLNAIVIEAEPQEAARLADVPGVMAVEPDVEYELDTDVSHDLIGTPAIWEGDTGPDLPTRGEGIVVGVLDSGINPDHPAFAATDGDGFTHSNPYPGFLGVCDPAHPDHEPICNDKLVGAWSFVTPAESPQDTNGHGSHTASTAAGNRHDVTLTYGADDLTRTVQGVAPRANLIAYKVCPAEFCQSSAILAAIDQAIDDEVDVINMSISGADNPWATPVSEAFLEAFGAGIFVATSAGNEGPDPGTAAHTAPWQASVAAATTDRIFANTLSVLGPAPVPPELTGIEAWPGFGPGNVANLDAELRYTRQVGGENACSSFPAGSFTGTIALVPLGTCPPVDKIINVADAGAVGAVLFDRRSGPPLFLSEVEGTTIPAVSVDQAAGEALQDLVYFAGGPVTVRLEPDTSLVRDSADADMINETSSRGPSDFDLLAPTISAPGANILAAYRALPGDPAQYTFLRGTSMASPHVAGAGALLMALHPTWSPAEVRAALTGTADPTGVLKEDGTPADPFDTGAGRIDVAGAGRVGLVLDESFTNMQDADPATGGDPRTLNVPYLVDQQCDTTCMWTRDVTSVADASSSYTAAVDVPPGVAGMVQPSSFTLAPGATQQLTITVDVSGSSGGDWLFADVVLSTSDQHAGGEPIAGVQYPVAVIPTAPAVNVEPVSVEAAQKPGHQVDRALAIQNQGNEPLEWELTGGTGCDLPAGVPWLAATELSGTVAPGSSDHPRLALDTTGLAPGVHAATLCVASNDPGAPQVAAPVTVTVLDAPTLEVTPAELVINQPAGTVTDTPLTIDNTGTAALDWSIGTAPVFVDPAALAGVDPSRRALLAAGVVLLPDNNLPGVAAFDPRTGDLLDAAFITYPMSLGRTIDVTLNPDGDGFLVSSTSQVHAFDLAGAYQGVFADGSSAGLSNIRGIAVSPWGTVLVAGSGSGNVGELDATGTHLGDFIAPAAGGMVSPVDVLIRDSDVLVSASNGVFQFDHSGTPLSHWLGGINNAQQLAEQADGNVLAAALSPPAGVWELAPDGDLVDIHAGVASTNLGVHPLAGGNILTTNFAGVHEVDRGATLLETKAAGGALQFSMISEVGPLVPCDDPAEVPWLGVSAGSGTTAAGADSQVLVQVDSTGLAPGVHEANLCVLGDDPDTPVVGVPVTVTVTSPTSGGDCLVDYVVDNQWNDGFQATVEIVNTSDTTVNGWTLTWTFTAGQVLQDLWGGIEDQVGPDVTVDDEGWNGTILPDDSISIGLVASHTGSNPDPVDFTLNGNPCDT